MLIENHSPLYKKQGTHVSYDSETKQWRFYSDIPEHAQKWEYSIKPKVKVYNEDGELIEIDGVVKGSISIFSED